MRNLPHLVPILLLLAPVVLAQDGPPPGGPGGMPDMRRMNETTELTADFDADGNGWLDRAERDLAREHLEAERERQRKEMEERFAERGEGRGGRRGGRRGRFGGPGGRGGPGGPPGLDEPVELPEFGETKVPAYPELELYDESVLRTIYLEFEQEDWLDEIEAFYRTDVEIPATMIVDGERYEMVGVRGRGNTSFRNPKKSLNVSIDMVNEDQRLHGYKTLNLLNANQDPSLMREVIFSHIARSEAVGPKANFVRVVVNGKLHGVHANVQQFNKDYLEDHFGTRKGKRWKVPPDFSGRGGLMFLGEDLEPYQRAYEAKSGSIDEDDWKALIDLCRLLEEASDEELVRELPKVLDVEATLRLLAVDNVLMDDDGYFSRASDYLLYLDPEGRFHLAPHDNNETLRNGRARGGPGGFRGRGGEGGGREPRPERGGPPPPGPPGGEDERKVRYQDPGGRPPGGGPERGGQDGARRRGRRGPGGGGPRAPLQGADDEQRPLVRRLMAIPAWREAYLRQVRHLAEHWLDWEHLGPLVEGYAAVIGDAAAVDPFLQGRDAWRASLTGEADSLKAFAAERRAFLLQHESITSLED